MKLLQITAFVIVFAWVSASIASAQDKYIVMSVKGKVEVLSGKNKWKPVQVGQELKSNDVLKTSFASYVKLMMDNTRLVGIDENTQKSLAEFSAQEKDAKGGNAKTILAYAAKQMQQTKQAKSSTEFGAVRGNREVFNATFPKYAIMTTQPEFKIVDAGDHSRYEIMILDSNFNTVVRHVVDKDVFVYPETLPAIAPGVVYYWKVARLSDGETSDIQRFSVLSKDSVAAIETELVNLKKELDVMGADDIMHRLIRGVYFEKKELYYNAYLEYKETVRLAPEVDEYRDILSNLLLKLSLYNEQEYLMK